jgi:hypothetical protein
MKAGSVDTGTPFGINLAVGVVIVLGASAVAGALSAVVDDWRAALATAGLSCLVFDGFLVNRYGELTWDGITSVWQVATLAVAAALGRAWRSVRSTGRRGSGFAELRNGRPPRYSQTSAAHRCPDPTLRIPRPARPAPPAVGLSRRRFSGIPVTADINGSRRPRNG